MNTAQPIRKQEDLLNLKNYYRTVKPSKRNYLLIVTGLNTALRISDILELTWEDVFDFSRQQFRGHICLNEQKTDKHSCIFMNKSILEALVDYRNYLLNEESGISATHYLFSSHGLREQHISRSQAFRIIKRAAIDCCLEGVISCHSLRKTFGYYAWKEGVPPALLMSIYNHSSFYVTKRYLGIEQDDRDAIFKQITL